MDRTLREWAKAYRETPEHRFPSDPHAEFFPIDLENAADEIGQLRSALIRSGRAVGAFLSDDVSTEFLVMIPQEIELVMARLKKSQ